MIRKAIYFGLGALGSLYRRTRSDALRVLAYHTVPDAANYARQLDYLERHYTIVGLDDLLASVRNETPLPANSVLITFDDGDYSVYQEALPLHEKRRIPAILFVITGLIDSTRPFWWKRVEMHYEVTGQEYAAARRKVAELKRVPNEERLRFLATLPQYEQRQLTSRELAELAAGGFALANHTVHHPIVSNCTDEEVLQETKGAAAFLQDLSPQTFPTVFAYPNGNCSERTEKLLRKAGAELTFLFDHALIRRPDASKPLSRIRVNTDDPLPEFGAKVDGIHSLIYHLRN